MSAREHKLQQTIRISHRLKRRAEEQSRRTGKPVAVVLSEAAEQMLIPPPEQDPQTTLETTTRSILTRIAVLDERLTRDLILIREMVGIAFRIYLNHTPELPESQREAANRLGRQRFVRYARHCANNARECASILDEHLNPVHRVDEEAGDAA